MDIEYHSNNARDILDKSRNLIASQDEIKNIYKDVNFISKRITSAINKKLDEIENSYSSTEKLKNDVAILSDIRDLLSIRANDIKVIRSILKNYPDVLNLINLVTSTTNYSEKKSNLKQLNEEVHKIINSKSLSPEQTNSLKLLEFSIKNTVLELQKYKTKVASDFILKSKNPSKTFRDEFSKGNLNIVKDFVKYEALDTLGSSKLTPTGVTELGNPKSTAAVEQVVPFLLDNLKETFGNLEKFNIIKKGDETIIQIKEKNQVIDLSLEDWINADLSKITLTSNQLDNYKNFLLNQSYFKPLKPNSSVIPTPEYFIEQEKLHGLFPQGSQIEYSEKLAINVYTGNAYNNINMTMKGLINSLSPTQVQEAMIHSIVVNQALTKLPGFVDPTGSKYNWRGEGMGFKNYGALDFIANIITGGKMVVASNSLTSSSREKPSNTFFNKNSPACQLIKSDKLAKDVSPYSQYPKERERLIPRCLFVYYGFATLPDKEGRPLTVFLSQAVPAGSTSES